MKILELNLKKQWFDMVLSGEKTEEYREIKKHWNRMFYKCLTNAPTHYGQCQTIVGSKVINDCRCYKCDVSEHKHFDAIRFSNGYSKDRRQMLVECKGIEIGMGYSPWGATDELTFILKLGEILETKNC